VGRHKIHVSALANSYRDGPRWSDPYHCEWSAVVGNRVRRSRRAQDLTLVQLARALHKPEGGHYSAGYVSRVERGWASAPLYVYLAIADVLGLDPGRLLGPDEVQKEVTDAELTLVRFLREAGVAPHEALARLAGLGRRGSTDQSM
jgi:transcriptional regulator with XRE-family HTH domain